MARLFGSKDSYKRKRKRLFKWKYRRKHGRLVPYVSNRKRDSPIKAWIWERRPMQKESYLRWNKNIRPHIHKVITRFVGRPVLVNPEDISSPEKIGEFVINIAQYDGVFLLMLCSHSKNSYHCSYKKKARIKVVETEEGLKAKVTDFSKMSHYWFFRGNR